MKKILLLSAIALLFTLFSCTADEYETPAKKEIEKAVNPANTTYADGPGDGVGGGTIPPPPEEENH